MSQQSQAQNHSDNKNSAIGGVFSKFILPIVIAVVTAAIVSSLRTTPNIPDSAAHTFLANYYSSIVNLNQRQDAYNNNLTSNFRSFPGHSWQSVNDFFSKEKQVTVDSVIPMSGNPDAFTASLSYYPRSGGEDTETTNFYLSCNNFWARFPFMSCTSGQLEIDITQTPSKSLSRVISSAKEWNRWRVSRLVTSLYRASNHAQ